MIEKQILSWYNKNKRVLPWRLNNHFYNVWISEIMLQQTRVNQAIRFYNHFMNSFPTLEFLAKAEEDFVLKNWEGLGYYSRARNLHFTAQHIFFELKNIPPNSFKELKKLKGIGDYTAAAIASICYKEPVCAVDGNVFRVFSRYFDLDSDIMLLKTRKEFFRLGNQIISKKSPGDFNQAIMELGATVCTSKKAQCEICPIQNGCLAFSKNKVYRLPVKIKKTKITDRFLNFFYTENGFLFQKRSKKGIWQNLYQFPLIETSEETPIFKNIEGLNIQNIYLKKELQHKLSHQNLFIKFWEIELNSDDFNTFAQDKSFIKMEDIHQIVFALPKPIERFISEFN
ncbi:MAG: A/G-specific adenine glycosylase [Flavobacteriales bacterium]